MLPVSVYNNSISPRARVGYESIDDGNGSENVSFKMNSRFFQSLSRLFQFAENGKCRRISLKGIETTLAAVILGFSTLSGTKFKPLKGTTSTPVTFIGEYPRDTSVLVESEMKINIEN